jgi:hypothetical protein
MSGRTGFFFHDTSPTEIYTGLGVRVAVDQEDVEDVAADFLASIGAVPVESPAA